MPFTASGGGCLTALAFFLALFTGVRGIRILRSSYARSCIAAPDALSPLVSLPLCGAHNTRWWEISFVAVLADRGGAIQLFDFLCRLA